MPNVGNFVPVSIYNYLWLSTGILNDFLGVILSNVTTPFMWLAERDGDSYNYCFCCWFNWWAASPANVDQSTVPTYGAWDLGCDCAGRGTVYQPLLFITATCAHCHQERSAICFHRKTWTIWSPFSRWYVNCIFLKEITLIQIWRTYVAQGPIVTRSAQSHCLTYIAKCA